MADFSLNGPKVRERLAYDQEQIDSKTYAMQRLRDLADDEERDMLRVRSQRAALIEVLYEKTSGTNEFFDLENILKEFGLLPTSHGLPPEDVNA